MSSIFRNLNLKTGKITRGPRSAGEISIGTASTHLFLTNRATGGDVIAWPITDYMHRPRGFESPAHFEPRTRM